MAQSKAFTDASHSLNELFHALALLESENSSLRGAVDGFTSENAKLRELLKDTLPFIAEETGFCVPSECFVYPACCEVADNAECPAVVRIHERARELGVEVSE